MIKKNTLRLSAQTGTVIFCGSLGQSKATKFLKVEGMSLNQESKEIMSSSSAQGLKGEALRSAITVSFKNKRA